MNASNLFFLFMSSISFAFVNSSRLVLCFALQREFEAQEARTRFASKRLALLPELVGAEPPENFVKNWTFLQRKFVVIHFSFMCLISWKYFSFFLLSPLFPRVNHNGIERTATFLLYTYSQWFIDCCEFPVDECKSPSDSGWLALLQCACARTSKASHA